MGNQSECMWQEKERIHAVPNGRTINILFFTFIVPFVRHIL